MAKHFFHFTTGEDAFFDTDILTVLFARDEIEPLAGDHDALTHFVCDCLTDCGREDEIYQFLWKNNEDAPPSQIMLRTLLAQDISSRICFTFRSNPPSTTNTRLLIRIRSFPKQTVADDYWVCEDTPSS